MKIAFPVLYRGYALENSYTHILKCLEYEHTFLVNHLEPSKRRHSAKRQAEQNGLQAATIGFLQAALTQSAESIRAPIVEQAQNFVGRSKFSKPEWLTYFVKTAKTFALAMCSRMAW